MSGKQRFTIAREQALATMREYALRHPDQWVLEAAACATLCGATQLAVDIDDSRLRVSWVGGERLQRHELTNLFDYLFAAPTDRTARRLQQLAIAANALIQKRAARITIVSGDGTPETTSQVVVMRDGTIAPADAKPVTGTVVSIPLRSSLFSRRSIANEALILRDRGMYLPMPVFINDIELFPGADTTTLRATNLTSSVQVDDGGTRAELGLARVDMPPTVAIVVGGIVVTRRPIPELGSRTAGVLWDDRLRKSADGADIVTDDAYRAALARCQQALLPLLQSAHASVSTTPFTAPALPSLPGALPDPIEQIGVRDAVTHDVIDTWPTDAPVFVVDPETPLASDRTLDPTEFPFPVLRVPTTQSPALAERFPSHRFARLTTSEDARFLRDLRLRTHPVWHSPPYAIPNGLLSLDIDVSATAMIQSTPVLRVVEGRTVALSSFPLALPGVRVRIDARELPELAVCAAAIRHALAGAMATLREQPVWVALAEAIQNTWATPAFVHTSDGIHVALTLPRELAQVQDDVLNTPIGRGPSALALAACMGTDRVLSVDPSVDILRYLPLELRLGIGHLTHPARTRVVLFAVGHGVQGWLVVDPSAPATLEGIDNALLVTASLAPDVQWQGWSAQPVPMPGVVHLVRDGSDAQPPHAGLMLLGRTLATQQEHDTLPEDPVARAVARRVRFATGNVPPAVRRSLHDGQLRVRPTGGLVDPDPHTLATTLDEAQLLFGDAPISLRFDDPPTAWHEPSHEAVCRVTVAEDFGTGWLELPRPYDATLGVMWTHQGVTAAVPSLDARWPCRGAIDATRALTEDDLAALHMHARRLYQQLPSDLDDRDAQAYRRGVQAVPSDARQALQRALHRTFRSRLTWLDDGPTVIRRTGNVDIRVGAPHQAMLQSESTQAAAVIDLATRAARASGQAPEEAVRKVTLHFLEWVGLPSSDG